MTPKVVRLEENLDPDEYVLKYGIEKFKTKINNPESSIEFLMDQHKLNKNLNDIDDVTKYINEALTDLVSLQDPIALDLTLKKMSTEYKVNYDILESKYQELKNKQEKKSNIQQAPKKIVKMSQQEIASRHLLFYMLKDDKIINRVEKEISFFPNSEIRDLANQIIYFYHKYGVLKIADFISYIANSESEINLFNEIINMKINDEYKEIEIADYIKVINDYPIKRKEKELRDKLKDEKDPLKQASILSEILSLKGVKQ